MESRPTTREDLLRKRQEASNESDNYFAESGQVRVNVTRSNDKLETTTAAKNNNNLDDYLDLVHDYDQEYDPVESNSNPLTSRVGEIDVNKLQLSGHYLNHRYPDSLQDDNLPGYSAPNGSNPSLDTRFNKQADLAADGAGFEVDPFSQSRPSPSRDVQVPVENEKPPPTSARSSDGLPDQRPAFMSPQSVPAADKPQPMIVRTQMFIKSPEARLNEQSNVQLEGPRPAVLYPSLDEQLLAFSTDHNSNKGKTG